MRSMCGGGGGSGARVCSHLTRAPLSPPQDVQQLVQVNEAVTNKRDKFPGSDESALAQRRARVDLGDLAEVWRRICVEVVGAWPRAPPPPRARLCLWHA